MKKFVIVLLSFLFLYPNHVMAEEKLIKTENKNEIMYIKSENGSFSYSWSFAKDYFINFDMGIKSKSPYQNIIDKLDSGKKEYVSFNHHGTLPGVATIKIPIKKFKDNSRLKLYYYNDKTNKVELIDDNVIVKNGYVTFEIKHCSDYYFKASVVKGAQAKNPGGIVIVAMIIIIVALLGSVLFRKD